MVADGDRRLRAGLPEQARACYLQAADLQAEIVSGLTGSRHLDTLACGCILLYRRAGSLLQARALAERFLQLPLDEPAEGWLLDQVSELTMGSYLGGRHPTGPAMIDLIELRRIVG